MDFRDVTIVVPTLNEVSNISKLLTLIAGLYPRISVIVADDGSRDGTQEVVVKARRSNRRIVLLDRRSKREHGLTASVLDGASMVKTAYIIVIDGDLQHPPEKIGAVVQGLREGKDVVIGTRTRVAGYWAIHRRMMSFTATALAQVRLRKRVQDPLSGFFGMRLNLLQDIVAAHGKQFELAGYKVLFDILKYLPRETRISVVGYTFGERMAGQSKIGFRQVVSMIRSLIR
jgi:dolichol-phosphate mannosyltransferase